MWVYQTEALLAESPQRTELFEFCRRRHITDLFWQTHYRVDRRTGAPYSCTITNATALRGFLRDANGLGFHIHALSGDAAYVLPENHARARARADATIAFNQAAAPAERFAGVHFDIEPHVLPQWKTADNAQRCRWLTQFVELNAAVVERLHARAPGLLYGADVAFWLDKTNADGSAVYPVTFRGKTKDPTKHLLDLIDNLGVMSYRNFAQGKNGLIDLTEKAINYADKAHGRAFVGVKMADIGPRVETFFGRTEQEMERELRHVADKFTSHRGYAGLAFFMYSAYRTMPQESK